MGRGHYDTQWDSANVTALPRRHKCVWELSVRLSGQPHRFWLKEFTAAAERLSDRRGWEIEVRDDATLVVAVGVPEPRPDDVGRNLASLVERANQQVELRRRRLAERRRLTEQAVTEQQRRVAEIADEFRSLALSPAKLRTQPPSSAPKPKPLPPLPHDPPLDLVVPGVSPAPRPHPVPDPEEEALAEFQDLLVSVAGDPLLERQLRAAYLNDAEEQDEMDEMDDLDLHL